MRSCLIMAHHNTNANHEECVEQPADDADTIIKHVRDRVLQEIGCTSTTFIGPTFRPKSKPETPKPAGDPKTNIDTPKPAGDPETPKIGLTEPEHEPETPNIEETLSEFYKELEQIDSIDTAADVSDQKVSGSELCKSLETSAEKDHVSVTTKALDTDFYQNSTRRPARPHWYQNQPYRHRDQRSSVDQIRSGGPAHSYAQNHWHQARNRSPFPRFNEPPFSGPPPPHFLPLFPGPRPQGMAPPHMNDNWNCSDEANQQQQDMCWMPPHDEYNRRPQDFNEDFPHYSVRNEWGHYEEGDRNEELCEQVDPCRPSDQTYGSLVLILLRGLPGSGKSTLATELLSTGPSGLALSTDDYFFSEDGYIYEPSQLGVAHEWNQSRAKEAMLEGRSPIIIDNTNIEAWEMKPYVKMALENGYRIDFVEPDTCWKCNPFELEKRNKHGVPQQKIAQMLDRFSFPISVDIVMNSQEPPHVSMRNRQEAQKRERFNSTNCNQQIHSNK